MKKIFPVSDDDITKKKNERNNTKKNWGKEGTKYNHLKHMSLTFFC